MSSTEFDVITRLQPDFDTIEEDPEGELCNYSDYAKLLEAYKQALCDIDDLAREIDDLELDIKAALMKDMDE